MESLKWFNYACKTQGINRAFTFHPELADKFRQLKKKLDAEQKIEVDLDLERRLVEEAKRKYVIVVQISIRFVIYAENI